MDNLNFIFTTKKVIIEGEHYIETTEGYEGQPAKWIRYGPIPEGMVGEVVKSLHDTASRYLYQAMFSFEQGILLPAAKRPYIYGRSVYESLEQLLANPRFTSAPSTDYTPPTIE